MKIKAWNYVYYQIIVRNSTSKEGLFDLYS
jgi:hypothetical protein